MNKIQNTLMNSCKIKSSFSENTGGGAHFEEVNFLEIKNSHFYNLTA